MDLLLSSKKLDRDKGLEELQHRFQRDGSSNLAEIAGVETSFLSVLQDSQSSWEAKHGALLGAKALSEVESSSDHFISEMRKYSLQLLIDHEARVRLAAGELCGNWWGKISSSG